MNPDSRNVFGQWPWRAFCFWMILALGLAAFGIGVTLGRTPSPTPIALVLVVGVVVASIGFGLLSLLFPVPLKHAVERLRKRTSWKALKWLFTFLYTGILGMGVSSQGREVDIWRWIAIVFLGAFLMFLLAALTRAIWGRWIEVLRRWQQRLSVLALLGFVAVLVVYWTAGATLWQIVLPFQLALLSLMLLLGSLSMVASDGEDQMDQAVQVLFPCIGLLVMFICWV